MSYVRYGFAVLVIVSGVLLNLIVGGAPKNGSDPFEGFLLGSLIYSVGIGVFIWGFGMFRNLQLVRNTPTSTIRSMAMGEVEINGEAKKAERVFKSPFSREKCIYCKYEVEEYHEDHDDSGGDWRTILDDELSREDLGDLKVSNLKVEQASRKVNDPDNDSKDVLKLDSRQSRLSNL